MAGFLTPLELEYFDGRTWKVTASFEYHVGSPDGQKVVVIPIGFLTDFASVPKLLWNVLPPTGSYGKAAVIHDWLYQTRQINVSTQDRPHLMYLCNRAEADAILNEGMAVLGTSRLVRFMVYWGVRLGGWKPWHTYRQAGL